MKKVINIFAFTFVVNIVFCQIPFYQDVFHGGVAGDGYHCGNFNDTGVLSIYIEPGSIIRKAFLFTIAVQSPPVSNVNLNGENIILTLNNTFITTNMNFSNFIWHQSSIINDITDQINTNSNTISIIPPQNQSDNPGIDGGYQSFYLLILYENPALPLTDVCIFQNNKNCSAFMDYQLSGFNPINPNYNVALTLNATDICGTFSDGSFVKINGNYIGLIGGPEDNSNHWCTGSKGSFYYQNNTAFGIGNDSADPIMAGPDVLANVETYLNSNTALDVLFTYQIPQGSVTTNPIHQLFLAYSTPCDTFSVSHSQDTAICQGENVSLFATGGQAYKWEPATDLSCSTCPNPVFTGDSTQLYTVRIWNNDSCSVVRPVKISVRNQPNFGNINLTPSICGAATGAVSASSIAGNIPTVSFNLDGGTSQSSGAFSSLGAGTHTITIKDGYGCKRDSVVSIGQVNNTIAQFSANPITGAVPFSVSLSNSSVFADQFLWSLNGVYQGGTFSNFTAIQTGSYLIELIAWQFDPACADTATLSITAFDSLMVQVPNIITANDDLINDFFSLITNLPLKGAVSILNRWGEVVYTYNGTFQQGQTVLWDGKFDGKNVTEGTYFYAIELNEDPEFPLAIDKSQLPLKLEGFVEVRR